VDYNVQELRVTLSVLLISSLLASVAFGIAIYERGKQQQLLKQEQGKQ